MSSEQREELDESWKLSRLHLLVRTFVDFVCNQVGKIDWWYRNRADRAIASAKDWFTHLD